MLLTPGRATVVYGGDPPLLCFGLGRLVFRVRPLAILRSPFYGYVDYDEEHVSRLRNILIVAAGPAVSLLTAAALAGVASLADGFGARLAWVGFWVATIQLLLTAAPIRYGRFFGPYAGDESDGLGILRLVRGQ